GELTAQLREAGCKGPQPGDLAAFERQLPLQQVLVARRECGDPHVRDSVGEVLAGVGGLAALELRVTWQGGDPYLRELAVHRDRRPRVGEEEPRTAFIVRKH